MRRILTVSLLAALCLGGCQKDAEAPTAPVAGHKAADSQAELKDVIERTPRYLVGITFPPVANQHPPLSAALRDYADAARADLLQAVKEADATGQGSVPYDLSLNFTDISQGGDVVVIAADGSLYTGGAHGIPLIARFTYLPEEKRLLQAADLVQGEAGWKAISDYVRKSLADEVDKRLAEDDVPMDERKEIASNAADMIEEGTTPEAASFAQFEPIPSADGKWFGLRFVFPPYQVGPYSDGTQTVDVPVPVLRAHLAPAYRARFTGG